MIRSREGQCALNPGRWFPRQVFHRGAVAAFLVTLLPMTVTHAQVHRTERVSVHSNGAEGDGNSFRPSVSRDGRFVVFQSLASTLVPGDTNGESDVFLRDRLTATTSRVSVTSNGQQVSAISWEGRISADGRFVAFSSWSDGLVPGDSNETADVFVHDRTTGQVTRVSVSSSGAEGNDASLNPDISSDGRFVSFTSYASDLVPGDGNSSIDIFLHDRRLGTTERVSVSSSSSGGNGNSAHSSVSDDGRFVAFDSLASNLVRGDTNGATDVFVRDRLRGGTVRVSVDSGDQEGDGSSFWPSISSTGQFTAFSSIASNLVPGDTNGSTDEFVHDRVSRTTTRVSVRSSGGQSNANSYEPDISACGQVVVFSSLATNLVRGDRNGRIDVFRHDRETGLTTRVSVTDEGLESADASLEAAVSPDGRFVAFRGDGDDLVAGDGNLRRDVFVRGPLLTVEVEPDEPVAGDTLTSTLWGGPPGMLALLILLDFDGLPVDRRYGPIGRFDSLGRWEVRSVVPPGLAGRTARLLGVGFVDGMHIDASNTADVLFR